MGELCNYAIVQLCNCVIMQWCNLNPIKLVTLSLIKIIQLILGMLAKFQQDLYMPAPLTVKNAVVAIVHHSCINSELITKEILVLVNLFSDE